MKATGFKITILALFTCVNLTWAADDEYSKTLKEEYSASASTELNLDNKFGDIEVNNWDKDIVSIEVTISVDVNDEDKANKILSYVDVNFFESGNTISAETVFDSKLEKGSWNNNYDLDIQYHVYIPDYIDLSVENKYGDTFINNLAGKLYCDIKYGKIKINELTRGDDKPLNEINIAYGNGNIEKVDWLKSSIKYSTLEIEEGKALILVSKYSKFYLDEASSLVAESKYDTYELGKLNNFVVSAGYSNYKVDEITKKFQIESKYTHVKVDNIPAGFEKISIENAYGGFKLAIDENASYLLDGEADYSKIYYPDNNSRVNRIVENNEMNVSGLVGEDSNTKSVVDIETRYGNVKLVE